MAGLTMVLEVTKPRVSFSAPKQKAIASQVGWEHLEWTFEELWAYESNVLHGNHEMSSKLFGPFAGLRARTRAEKLAGKVQTPKVNKALEALTEDERVQLLQILQGAAT